MNRQIYEFYLAGIQPKDMDRVLEFAAKYSTLNHEKRLISVNGDIIMNIKFQGDAGGFKEMICYVDSCIAKSWK